MGLTSVEFVLFLPIVIFLYYMMPKVARPVFLLAINLLFYATFGISYICIILFDAVIAWLSGYVISDPKNAKKTKVLLSVSIFLLFVPMAIFRILPSFNESILGPLGISFYTLQAVSYVVDVYKKEIDREKSFWKLLTYLSFFVTITAGPIYRFKDFGTFYDNASRKLKANYEAITNGIIYTIWGFMLKVVVADRIAIPINTVFSNFQTENYGGIVLILIAFLYSIQIYADFAGYSAIVIGIAQMLGYTIPENFKAPYLSMSIKEFWSRWHISLSTWLRDYIYIPLGGNRHGKVRKAFNVMITFMVSGLWHGTAFNYIIWGALHAFYQIIGDLTSGLRKRIIPLTGIRNNSFFHRMLKRVGTFLLVTFAWIFFRNGVNDSIKYIGMMFGNFGGLKTQLKVMTQLGVSLSGWALAAICSGMLIVSDVVSYKKDLRVEQAAGYQGPLFKALFVITLSLMILLFGEWGVKHDAAYFIYRDF
ncbi:MAG: hypothetical protein K6A74_02960 [Lachnospiraceae bacterium]|nr:hypothetical protein [Lachnospiraceae bacterium]